MRQRLTPPGGIDMRQQAGMAGLFAAIPWRLATGSPVEHT
jgi:hypothetical protein